MAIYHNKAGVNFDAVASGASQKSYVASAKADISILKTADATAFLITSFFWSQKIA